MRREAERCEGGVCTEYTGYTYTAYNMCTEPATPADDITSPSRNTPARTRKMVNYA